jgi:tetraacyldisaccharide 4'-kinase
LKAIIREKTGARLFTSLLAPLDMVEGRTGTVRPLSSLARARVLALAGIARPAFFISLLKSLGAVVAAECVYPDHYVFEKNDLAEVYKRAADEKVDIIVTTEKDAVRLKNFNAEGIWALRVEQRVLETGDWERMLLEQPA